MRATLWAGDIRDHGGCSGQRASLSTILAQIRGTHCAMVYEEYKGYSSTPLDYLLGPIKEKGTHRALRLDWVRGRSAESDQLLRL